MRKLSPSARGANSASTNKTYCALEALFSYRTKVYELPYVSQVVTDHGRGDLRDSGSRFVPGLTVRGLATYYVGVHSARARTSNRMVGHLEFKLSSTGIGAIARTSRDFRSVYDVPCSD